MSLFGGDSAPSSRQPSEEQPSDFSISPIQSPAHAQDPDLVTENESQIPHHQAEPDEELGPSSLASYSGDDDDDEDNEGADIRPNRFGGPRRAWKYYTREERALATSLDTIDSVDLSLHLYNTHAWKARLRRNHVATIAPLKRKSEWIEKGEDGKKSWYPDETWTAWPQEPDVVPREGIGSGGAKNGYTRSEHKTGLWPKSTESLKDQLLAVALKTAKDQWNARHSAHDESLSSEKRPKNKTTAPTRDRSPDVSRRRSSRSRSVSQAPDSRNVTSDEDHVSERPDQPDAQAESKTPVAKNAETALLSIPVITADDDRSRMVLQPTVNHLLSQLDDLLMALHYNRQGHHAFARDDGDMSDSSATSRSRSRSRSRTGRKPAPKRRRAKQASRKGGADRQDNPDPAVPDTNKRVRRSQSSMSFEGTRERSASVASSQRENYSGGSHITNLRDWSEVLGLAAMTGWKPAVLERAANRCAALFGESMSFRSIPERGHNHSDPSVVFDPKGMVETGALSANAETFMSSMNMPETQGYHCPEEDCRRHFKPFPLNKGYRFRAHLQDKHKYSKQDIQDIELALHMGGTMVPSTKFNPRGWEPPDPLVCPHPEACKTRSTFSEPRRLIDHLRRTHKYDPRKQSPPGRPSSLRRQSSDVVSRSSSPEIDDNEFDDEMVGGVHNDGFLRPVGVAVNVRERAKRVQAVPSDELQQRVE